MGRGGFKHRGETSCLPGSDDQAKADTVLDLQVEGPVSNIPVYLQLAALTDRLQEGPRGLAPSAKGPA